MDRRQVLVAVPAVIGAAIIGMPDGFIPITDNGEFITSPLPSAYDVVEVLLRDGAIRRAEFDCHIMEVGDWDFLPVELSHDRPDMEADSIADQVVAWRRIDGRA